MPQKGPPVLISEVLKTSFADWETRSPYIFISPSSKSLPWPLMTTLRSGLFLNAYFIIALCTLFRLIVKMISVPISV
jgi:hypothetical protein